MMWVSGPNIGLFLVNRLLYQHKAQIVLVGASLGENDSPFGLVAGLKLPA